MIRTTTTTLQAKKVMERIVLDLDQVLAQALVRAQEMVEIQVLEDLLAVLLEAEAEAIYLIYLKGY